MYDKKITVIFKYLTQLKQTISLQEKFYILINMAKELIEVDRCTIWRYDTNTNELVAKFAHGIEIELREPISSGVVGYCFRTKETILIEDVQESEFFDHHIDTITGYETKNIISIPIVNSKNEVMGVFQALNKQSKDNKFHEDDIKLLDLVTLYMAEVFESSILYENLEERVAKEVEKNKQKDELLYEQAKNVALGEMIGNIAHQWRQPLSVISLAAGSIKLEKEMDMLDLERLPEKMDLIIHKSEYLSNTINTFRDFIKNEKVYKNTDVIGEINNALTILKTVLDDYNIVLNNRIDSTMEINIDLVSGELQQVIINIINNAKDALLEKRVMDPWISMDVEKKEDSFVISIEDNAGGIPEEIKSRIFEPYFTTKHQSQGTGLGLHICYRIINESFKGNIYVKNTSSGASFCIELPFVKNLV